MLSLLAAAQAAHLASDHEPARLSDLPGTPSLMATATEHAAELDRQTVQRLLALPGDLWLDVCGDGFDDEEDG